MHSALFALLQDGLEGAAYVAAVMLGSYVSLWAAHFLAVGILSRKRG